MNRRKWVAGIGALLASAGTAMAATKKYTGPKSVTYTVPSGIDRIRVRSWKGEEEVIDTHFSVEPGQTFRIDAA